MKYILWIISIFLLFSCSKSDINTPVIKIQDTSTWEVIQISQDHSYTWTLWNEKWTSSEIPAWSGRE